MITVCFTFTCDGCGTQVSKTAACDYPDTVSPYWVAGWTRNGTVQDVGRAVVSVLCPECTAKKEQERKERYG